jgi:uncharacterized protein (TIGR04141 family)
MAKTKKQKTVTLRVMLIKAGITDNKAIFNDFDKLKHVTLAKDVPFTGIFAWRKQGANVPSWLAFVKPHLNGGIDDFKNASTAAILLIEAEGRRFAFTFGYGRNLLNPEAYERDFGLRVALNTISPTKLRSVDCRNFEELTVQTRRQTSRASTLDSFAVNAMQDLLRQVMGEPTNTAFAKRLAGSDGLMLATPIVLPDLAKKCKELLAAYKSTEYQKRGFAFIDHLHRERDPTKMAILDDLLVKTLVASNFDDMHMAPPEPIDMQDVDKFVYSGGKKASTYDELESTDLVDELGGAAEVTLENLKRRRVGVKFGTSEYGELRWSAYSTLVFEMDHNGSHYVLTCGEWFEVQKSFVQTVAKRVKELSKAATLKLPAAKLNDSEDSYNQSLQKSQNFVLLDKKCSRAMGTEIEVCDLFTPKKQFIHVKRKTRSATLSHLFSQGVISADCFLDDEQYRKEVKALIAKSNAKLAAAIEEDRPKTSDYEVVYAILSKANKKWPLSLPFFSQLNLMNAADHLARMQYKVSLVHVKQE